jgi:hypothetical protein
VAAEFVTIAIIAIAIPLLLWWKDILVSARNGWQVLIKKPRIAASNKISQTEVSKRNASNVPFVPGAAVISLDISEEAGKEASAARTTMTMPGQVQRRSGSIRSREADPESGAQC